MTSQRKQNRKLFTVRSIVQAANDLFLQNGVEKTTMDDIAAASDYSKSTLYVYFKSKEDILHHIIYDGMALFNDSLTQLAAEHSDFKQFFFAVCELLVSIHDTYPVHFQGITGTIAATSELGVNPELLERIYTLGEANNALIAGKAAQGIAQGHIKPDTAPLESTLVLWACIYGIIDMASAKADYFEKRLQKDRQAFMRYGFAMLFTSIAQQGHQL